MLTKESFEAAYAARSGITVDELHGLGRFAIPCDCGEDICEKWQMLTRDQAIEVVTGVTYGGVLMEPDKNEEMFYFMGPGTTV